ncbi:hypothetical protein L2E82_36263 [Cichorium intybus]|uniref:Uncharacterized protein n=1 Tax=Cichorium intybus TaxID=13427 RepID=A0ACB9BR72_CICIN|nr:hypothetical protein L2E82_36263 [Cichorium intybus]
MLQPLILIHFSCSSFSFVTFLFTLLLLSEHGRTRVTLPKNVVVPAVIAFGDSIVDQGANNNLSTLVKANFSPYGKDFVDGKPTGRFSNNKTPADMIGKVCISHFSSALSIQFLLFFVFLTCMHG